MPQPSRILNKVPTTVLVTGGFDPLHGGHLRFFKEAKKLGDYLIVGVNSDEWLTRKKGRPFMSFEERRAIVSNLKMVDYAFGFDDDNDTAIEAIQKVKSWTLGHVIFANGGDRTSDNIPEMDVFDDVQYVFGVGGSEKTNSSSSLLQEWQYPRTERPWGYYRVLHNGGPSIKVKELVVNPGSSLSMQKHFHRSELWMVAQGEATLALGNSPYSAEEKTLKKFDVIDIPVGSWHRLSNKTESLLSIIEIQYGDNCIEEDICRL